MNFYIMVIQQSLCGYAGLCECTRYMTGKSHTDQKQNNWHSKLLQHMNDACNKWRAESNIDFSLYWYTH